MDFKDATPPVLAAQVVVYQSLGLNKELAMACMAELALRRQAGETFEYEKFIEEEVAKIPKPTKSPSNILQQAFSLLKVIKK